MKIPAFIIQGVLILSLAMGAVACGVSKSTDTSGSPSGPSPTPTPTPTPAEPRVLVLTLEQDTTSPVGQAVAITVASFGQEPGKIGVAVSGFNLRNDFSPTTSGFYGASGRLKWDDALLEIDAAGPGDLIGRTPGTSCCIGGPEIPGTFPFNVSRTDRSRVTGSGELFLLRLKPRAGITSGTTRIEFVPFLANEGAVMPFMTPLLLSPYSPVRGNVIDNAYGGTITIRPGN